MGRALKRVTLDFDWPINKIWEGYLNPYKYIPCAECDQSGYNPATKELADAFYSFSDRSKRWSNKITQEEVDYLISKNRLRGFDPVSREWVAVARTAEEVNLSQDYISFDSTLMHDAINRSYLIKFRATKLGVYGLCSNCKGDGYTFESEEIENLYNTWELFEPPVGEGYQLWETTTEGSPQSPVFETLEELCEWCEPNATVFSDSKASKEEWKTMFSEDMIVHREGNLLFI